MHSIQSAGIVYVPHRLASFGNPVIGGAVGVGMGEVDVVDGRCMDDGAYDAVVADHIDGLRVEAGEEDVVVGSNTVE